jgi:hypothetical protein
MIDHRGRAVFIQATLVSIAFSSVSTLAYGNSIAVQKFETSSAILTLKASELLLARTICLREVCRSRAHA